jgi:ABC-2 type transport system ATP-binding protein
MKRFGSLVLALGLSAALAPSAPAAQAPRIEDGIVIESFDGTPIVATFILPPGASPRNRVPVVFMTHGWGGVRERTPGGALAELLERGYALLTWDSRGFGESGGEANVGAPGFEVRDARALIDWVARRPEIKLDGPHDPRMGWIGGSNAGGVQLNTAAVDRRVDAIVPIISWGDLVADLLPHDVAKQTWDLALYAGGAVGASLDGARSPAGPQTGVYAGQIHEALVQTAATGDLDDDLRAWFAHRSTTARSADVTAPTLIIQGSVDTLFPLEDGFANYLNLRRAGTPVKLMTYCAGHTLSGCPYPGGESGHPNGSDRLPVWQQRLISWLDRHVKGRDVSTGPAVEWAAQDGFHYGAPSYPLPGTRTVRGDAVVAGPLVGPGPGGGDGPADGNPAPDAELGISAARATVIGRDDVRRPILGIPEVRIEGHVTGLGAFLFFELVDVAPDGTRITVDDQTMPVRLGSGDFSRRVGLHGVSWILEPGHSLELEVTTGSTQYAFSRMGPFVVDLKAVPLIPVGPTRFAAQARRAR